jgi:hypothetical protein
MPGIRHINNNIKTTASKRAKRIVSSTGKTNKHAGAHARNLPAFFQKNFGIKSANVISNTSPKLKTTHRSYYPTQDRIIVIGDIHGDLDKLIDCLLLSGCVKLPGLLPEQAERTNLAMYNFFNGIKWTGGATHIVQLGDQIDRIRPTNVDHNNIAVNQAFQDEGSSLHIFYLLWFLNHLAREHGGRVISVIGNHEFMNVEGDFRYVSPHEFKEYHDAFKVYYNGTLRNDTDDQDIVNNIKEETSKMQNIPAGYMERRIALHPGGLMSNFMGLHYKLCIQIGKWLFVHAGLTPNLCSSGDALCTINNSISRYLIQGSQNPNSQDSRIFNRIVNNSREDTSPVWNREFGEPNQDGNTLTGKFRMLIRDYNKTNQVYHEKNGVPPAEYLAIGHSPQFWAGKGINDICNGRVWRCDVGMSRAFLDDEQARDTGDQLEHRQPAVLEILRDSDIKVLRKN